jgi:hypothetical protein
MISRLSLPLRLGRGVPPLLLGMPTSLVQLLKERGQAPLPNLRGSPVETSDLRSEPDHGRTQPLVLLHEFQIAALVIGGFGADDFQ